MNQLHEDVDFTYLSKDTATRLYTDAATDTPCMYGTVLHIHHPNIQAENKS